MRIFKASIWAAALLLSVGTSTGAGNVSGTIRDRESRRQRLAGACCCIRADSICAFSARFFSPAKPIPTHPSSCVRLEVPRASAAAPAPNPAPKPAPAMAAAAPACQCARRTAKTTCRAAKAIGQGRVAAGTHPAFRHRVRNCIRRPQRSDGRMEQKRPDRISALPGRGAARAPGRHQVPGRLSEQFAFGIARHESGSHGLWRQTRRQGIRCAQTVAAPGFVGARGLD